MGVASFFTQVTRLASQSLLSLLRSPGWYHKAFCPFAHLAFLVFETRCVHFLGFGVTAVCPGAMLTGLYVSESLFKSPLKWPVTQEASLVPKLSLTRQPTFSCPCSSLQCICPCAYLLLLENRACSLSCSISRWLAQRSIQCSLKEWVNCRPARAVTLNEHHIPHFIIAGETIQGLRANLTNAIETLCGVDSSVAVSSGGELFLRFISLTSLEYSVSPPSLTSALLCVQILEALLAAPSSLHFALSFPGLLQM